MKKYLSILLLAVCASANAQTRVEYDAAKDINNDGVCDAADVASLVDWLITPTIVTNDYEYVDLGITDSNGNSICFATTNVGASSPEGYGDYFAWGETTGKNGGKNDFSWSTYKWCEGTDDSMTKYCFDSEDLYGDTESYGTVDNKATLEIADDAARANWGGDWRMPTADEMAQLSNKCTWTETTFNSVKGYEVKGTNGNSIFLPYTGYYANSKLCNKGVEGLYWSSSLDIDESKCAYHLSVYYDDDIYTPAEDPNKHDCFPDDRCYGLTIRPVIVIKK